MNFTDKLTILMTDLNDYGEEIPGESIVIDCKAIAKTNYDNNIDSSSNEVRKELKIYVPYKRTAPYSSFISNEYKKFEFEDVRYDLSFKAAIKDFFGKIHHYEMTITEDKNGIIE